MISHGDMVATLEKNEPQNPPSVAEKKGDNTPEKKGGDSEPEKKDSEPEKETDEPEDVI